MPEGPEVTITAIELDNLLKGAEITGVEITPTSRYRDKAPDNFIPFQEALPLGVEGVHNKGKLIYFQFSKRFYLLNTLGMSGGWSHRRSKHTSFSFTYLLDGLEEKIYFTDVRHFGTLKFIIGKGDLEKKLKTLGPDMLNDPDMSFQKFKRIMDRHSSKNITKVLMNQCIISGVGNYLKSEALYHAGIHPLRKVESLSEEELERLYQAIRLKIVGSFNQGGVSVKDFTDIEDKKGQFQFQFQVYGRNMDRLGNKVKRITTPDGRSTFYVEEIQK